jgi:hypothetical protein
VARVSVRVLLSCDGQWPQPGRATCPAFLIIPTGVDPVQFIAAADWSIGLHRVLCSAHTRQVARGR